MQLVCCRTAQTHSFRSLLCKITINASVSDQRAMQLAAHAAIQLDASGVKDTLEI